MKVTNIVKREDGATLFDVKASPEETAILINIALDCLISYGKLSMDELEENENGIREVEIDLSQIPEDAFYHD